MTTRTLLINHLTGLKLAEWENEPDDITRLDEDPNGFWLIRVPDEEQYFLINPGDTIIFHSPNHCETHCAIAIFKDYCDKENRLIKVKSYFATIDNEPTIEPKRKFIRIITTYYSDDLSCYEEYKGKPYFSIEYQENGKTFVGYGTYNPDVLSRYLRDYFLKEE